MKSSRLHGTIGCIKPSSRPGSHEDLVQILPDEIGVVPVFLNAVRGTRDEWIGMRDQYENKIEYLVELGVDIIHAEGAAAFIVHGYKGERQVIDEWERKYDIPIFTSAMNHVRALKAMNIRRCIGVRPGIWDADSKTHTEYYRDAGIDVKVFKRPDTTFREIGRITGAEVHHLVGQALFEHPDVDGIFLLGSGMRVGHLVESLEHDFGVPVVSALTARCWEFQKRMCVSRPIQGYGRLLWELP